MKDFISLNRLTKGQNIPRLPYGDAALIYDFDGALKVVDGDTVSKVGTVPEPPANSGLVSRSNGKWVKPLGTPTVIKSSGDPNFLRVFYGNIPESLNLLSSQSSGSGSVFVGSSAENIADSAFSTPGNVPVKFGTAVISEGVTSIGFRAFRDNSLTSVVIPGSVTIIGAEAFQNNSLTSVVISEGVTIIEGFAFQNNSLTSVVIPESVTSISFRAFAENSLTSVVIPGSVTSIGNAAFQNNSLTSVNLPYGLKSVGQATFKDNPQLSDIFCLAEESVVLIRNFSEQGRVDFRQMFFVGSQSQSSAFQIPQTGSSGVTGVQRIHVAVNDDTWTAGPLLFNGSEIPVLVIKDLPPIPLPRPVEPPSGSGSSGDGSGVGVGLV